MKNLAKLSKSAVVMTAFCVGVVLMVPGHLRDLSGAAVLKMVLSAEYAANLR
jgi:hypothetical protein